MLIHTKHDICDIFMTYRKLNGRLIISYSGQFINDLFVYKQIRDVGSEVIYYQIDNTLGTILH